MGKPKKGPRKLIGVTSVLEGGKQCFKAFYKKADGSLVELGTFARAAEASRTADLATLACGRKGPLNAVKGCYLQKDIDKQKERLRQLGVLLREPKSAAADKPQRKPPKQPAQQQQEQQQQQQQQQEEVVLEQPYVPPAPAAQPLRKEGRKRKAASPGLDTAPTSPRHTSDQQLGHETAAAVADRRPKRRKVQDSAADRPLAADAGALMPEPGHHPHRKQRGPQAAAVALAQPPAPISTALVPHAAAAAVLMPTGAPASLGAGSANQELLLGQLRSALAAHEHSKQQLRAALNALEASEGQLTAVARATGLQL
jgi:hypothetical protein